ncbi:MAG: hypothetical protein LBG06_11995 [Deltaproteobacteria bacterium]|nr:hypothetical protein [Deltaproteobacteria bacterium]
MRDLDGAGRVLAQGAGRGAPEERARGFVLGFAAISCGLGKNALLGEKWPEFRETLHFPEGGAAAVGSLPAEAFFNEDALLPRRYSDRFFSAIPNYLTGIGILGTFLGLAAGLYRVNQELSGGNYEQAVLPLLDGAKLAFVTSVVGLLLSIVFSMAEKRVSREISERLAGFNALLDASVIRVSPEVTARMHLELLSAFRDGAAESSAARLAVQTGLSSAVRPFLEGFEASVGGLLSRNVADALSGQLGTIAATLREMHEQRSLETSRAVKAMADAFLESLHGATRDAAESVAESLRLVAAECIPVTDALKEVNRSIAANIGAGGAVAGELKGTSSELTLLTAALSEAAADAKEASRGILAAAETVSEGHARFSESLERAISRTLDGQTAALKQEIIGQLRQITL